MKTSNENKTRIHCLFLLPLVERFDGKGGAVATWVRQVLNADISLANACMVFTPHVGYKYAKQIRTINTSSYDVIDRFLSLLARIAAFLLGKSPWSAYLKLHNMVPFWEYFTKRQLKKIYCEVLVVENRPQHLVKILADPNIHVGKPILHMHNDLVNYASEDQIASLVQAGTEFWYCSEYIKSKAMNDFPQLVHAYNKVVYNGVTPVKDITPPSRRQILNIIYAGRLIPQKGPDRAIDAIDELLTIYPVSSSSIQLFIIGGTGSGIVNYNTSYKEQLISAAKSINKRYGRDIVRLTGPMPHSALMSMFAKSSLLLYPCRWEEPFGMVVLEAMSHGCIPVATSIGGIPEILTSDESGILLQPNATSSVIASLIYPMLQSPPLMARLSANAHKRSLSFSWRTISQQVVQALTH